jgi:hypothetical protein
MTSLIVERKKITQEIAIAIPGLSLVLVIAFLARFLQSQIPGPTLNRAISDILIAVLIGLAVSNTLRLPLRAQPGITFAIHRLLRLGIIFLGLRLSLQDVIATGLSSLLLIILCITLALTLAFTAGRLFKVPIRLTTLIGVGTAICGNSAIVATAPTIDAKEDEVGFAVATITLFGLLAVIFYPLIGQWLHLTDRVFGIWSRYSSQRYIAGGGGCQRIQSGGIEHRDSRQIDSQYVDGTYHRLNRFGLSGHGRKNSSDEIQCRQGRTVIRAGFSRDVAYADDRRCGWFFSAERGTAWQFDCKRGVSQ